MTIKRDGKTYELTDEEIRFIIAAEHEKDIRYEYAEAVSRCEEENWISFESWSECSFGTYSSENEAREDFIDKLTEDYLEQEELYERNPNQLYNYDFDEDVIDFAKDCDFLTEEM